jgi:hypothetical protein
VSWTVSTWAGTGLAHHYLFRDVRGLADHCLLLRHVRAGGAHREHNPTRLDCLAVNFRFMLLDVTAEEPVPEAISFFTHGGHVIDRLVDGDSFYLDSLAFE